MAKATIRKRGATPSRTIADVEKKFGKGVFMNMREKADQGLGAVSTGSIGLDRALGIGGVAAGRVIEIFGPESSGKTTLTLHVVAEAQKKGGLAVFIDAEHALDPAYAEAIGVNFDRVLVNQPDSGEQALQLAEMMVRNEEVAVVVIDSVAALTPQAEIDGEVGDHHVGAQARMMSQACRKIAMAAAQHDTMVIFINQLRQKIGVSFGSGETTTGGKALKFYASMRLDIRRIATLKTSDGAAFANKVRVKVVKNKCAPPFGQAEFEIIYGKGICQSGEILDMALDAGLVQKSGAWYSYGDRRLGQGREKAKELLESDAALMTAVKARLLGAEDANTDAERKVA